MAEGRIVVQNDVQHNAQHDVQRDIQLGES
jgi:hypothetical protein